MFFLLGDFERHEAAERGAGKSAKQAPDGLCVAAATPKPSFSQIIQGEEELERKT